MTPELLHILACPACRGALTSINCDAALRCQSCDKEFPVVDGIPLLLAKQLAAAPVTDSDSP